MVDDEGAGRLVGSISKTTAEIKALAQQHGPACIARLAELSGVVEGIPAESEAARIAALKELLDRGFGRPIQNITGEDGDGIRVRITIDDARVEP